MSSIRKLLNQVLDREVDSITLECHGSPAAVKITVKKRVGDQLVSISRIAGPAEINKLIGKNIVQGVVDDLADYIEIINK